MLSLTEIIAFLKEFAPLELAEEWDNVGLLLGDPQQAVRRVMTCLTLTPDVADEAIRQKIELIITHHPILFRPIQRLTAESADGRMFLNLIAAGIAVYSPHTAFDSAADGINQSLAASLGLRDIDVLRPAELSREENRTQEHGSHSSQPASSVGGGRFGRLEQSLSLPQFCERVKTALAIPHLQFVGEEDRRIERVAVACGAAAEFLTDAQRQACDVLVTGEARFHACLEARNLGMGLVLAGHYATERPAVAQLADRLSRQFPDLNCCVSGVEQDPLQWSV